MKKTITLLALLLITTIGFAQSFVMINTDNQQKTEELFNNNNLTIHYYNDNFVLGTAKTVDENMTVLDSEAFSGNDVYTLIYCPQAEQQSYLGDGEALLQTTNFVIVKGAAMPYKNDGAVAIFNKEAKLPVAHRDFPVVTFENPTIREMMNQVNMDSLEATVQHLQDYQSRIWNSDNAFAASDWIAARMAALGLEVEQQPFYASTWTGSGQAAPNVIGIQRGTVYPNTYVVCGSHFDSFAYSGNCPGADDNATGVASVLESARIMTQYEFEYSIIYCAYGCEEMGLYGSEAYASRCQQQGMDIIGYFNNDMNGYLYGDTIHIDCIYPNSVAQIGDYYMNVADTYFPEMQVRHVLLLGGDSDHTSFNQHGYMGIYPFEDVDHYSPYIHTSDDLIGNSVNSFAMSQRYCQMNIGCLSEIANPVGSQVYCNPVNDFAVEYPYVADDYSTLRLSWTEPSEGSTGTLVRFDVYRDNDMVAETTEYEFIDEITENVDVDYYVMAVYSDGCWSASETITVHSVLDVPEIDDLNEEVVRYEVYDMMGRLVYSEKTVWKNINEILVTDLESGIYMIRLFMQNGNTINQKVFKK
ncbi:MAG: M28 family peptidase [Bacteroidales bacterium]|nr:M28 family peptidase [Bacteroidales bacterium]